MHHLPTPEERKKLAEAQITSINDIWQMVDDDFDQGLERVASRMGISPVRLYDLLVGQLLSEIDERNHSGILKWWTNFKIHTLDIILAFMALILVFLVLRAGVTPATVNSSLELQTTVIVAARDLELGLVINSEDLLSSRLAPQNDYFKTRDALEGLIIGKRVPGQKPIRYSDVLRFQVVTTADIPVGVQLDYNNVKMSWSTYRPTAFTSLDRLNYLKARIAIPTGSVLTSEAVEAISGGTQPTSER